METTIELKLDAGLVERLKQTTAEQGVTLEQVLADLAQKYVADAWERVIDQETESYKILHPHLKDTYLGQHVAIHEGKLIDHDTDASNLVRRVQDKYRRVPILITQVHEQPVREFVIRSPHLAKTL